MFTSCFGLYMLSSVLCSLQVDKVTGRFNGQFKTYAICGAIRRMVSLSWISVALCFHCCHIQTENTSVIYFYDFFIRGKSCNTFILILNIFNNFSCKWCVVQYNCCRCAVSVVLPLGIRWRRKVFNVVEQIWDYICFHCFAVKLKWKVWQSLLLVLLSYSLYWKPNYHEIVF